MEHQQSSELAVVITTLGLSASVVVSSVAVEDSARVVVATVVINVTARLEVEVVLS